MEKVSFSYGPDRLCLKEIEIRFPKGQVTALVGPSGSGKTTLLNLLLGLLKPTGGRILVDGVDLSELDPASWRRRIGFVPQDPFLLHGTIEENILFGRTGVRPSAVRWATQIAHADRFISELPLGDQTVVGERGMKLSGGQQQRINIARAVLDDPEILIFDEATSSLDAESERLVQDALGQVSTERTVIVVAHRLSTIRHADKIVVLDQGRVMEEGSHEELLRGQGRYFRLQTPSQVVT